VPDNRPEYSRSNDESVAESEERLRIATEAADMFAWEIDLVANTLKWAPNSARVIGCTVDELSDDPVDGAFFARAEDRLRILNEFNSAISRGDDSYTLKFRGASTDRDRAFWQVRGTLMRNAAGVVTRAIGATQNITKQKYAEDALRLVAERLTTAEEAAGALIYDWDIPTNTLWRSGGVTRILGWLPDEIEEGMEGWIKLRHPVDQSRLAKLTSGDHAQANDRYVFEYRMRHKAGHYVWVLDSGRLFRDASGTVVRTAGATVDISARKKGEASISRQANLIDLSFEPIFVWHPKKGIVEWNRGASQLYGYSREEAIGMNSHELLKTTLAISREEFLDTLMTSKSWTGELEHRAKDGRSVFVESRQQAIDSEGEILILETNHDISQRKWAETYTARMAAVAVASHDALFGVTLNGIVETWNPAAERLFGYSAADIIGQHVNILADPEKHEEQDDFMRLAHSEGSVGPYDARRLHKNGSPVDVSVALAPVKAPDGRVLSISVAVHDIGDRRELQARQRLMTRELAHRIKNAFAVLQGILRSTLRTARSPNEFAEAFSGRLHSLAAAQDVLTENDWRGAELGALARRQLAAYVIEGDNRIDIIGPDVNLPADYAAPLGLIFNELATNAMKYGALSVPTGNIQLFWRLERFSKSKLKILITWRERGGPKIDQSGARGFGSALIEKSLADAKVESLFEPEGLTCKIEFIITRVRKFKRRRKVAH
jgi:PAS domain S-box-containing protein